MNYAWLKKNFSQSIEKASLVPTLKGQENRTAEEQPGWAELFYALTITPAPKKAGMHISEVAGRSLR